MVVNTTTHADADVSVLTNKAMKDLLEELMKEYCSAKERAENLTSDVNCEMKEYEHTKEVIDKIDDLQKILFHENSEKAKLKVMLGYIDIMKILDNHIKTSYEEEAIVRCQDEIRMIKTEYM